MKETLIQREALATAIDYIDKLLNGAYKIAEFIQTGKKQEATEIIFELVEGIQWLTQVLSGTSKLHSIDISAINPILSEIVAALQNLDYVMLADLLEYELTDVLSNWKQEMQSVIQ